VFDDSEPDSDLDPNDESARNIWKHLDLLMSFAKSQTSGARHDEPRSLGVELSVGTRVAVQTEFDHAVIA